jgi:hypothetical protein
MILNFSHPLAPVAKKELEAFLEEEQQILTVPVNLDLSQPMEPQVVYAVRGLNVNWETIPLFLIPPGMSPAALILAAAVHGLSGHWPSIIRLVQREDKLFHFAECIHLDNVRLQARLQRF